MRFVFNQRKAAQAAAQLLLLHEHHSMELYRLIKLLYLADRRALLETGYTITGDKMVSMRWGPVLSGVYDAIKDAATPGFRSWAEYIGRGKGNRVVLSAKDPEADELSAYESRLLADVHSEFGDYGFIEFSDLTHDFPEWHDPGTSSSSIAPEEILRRVGGKSESEVERLVADADAHWRTAQALVRRHW